LWYGELLPRLHYFLPARHLLEIACGFGRMTQYLLGNCESYTGVDLVERCVAHCRQRFEGFPKARFHLTDGKSLDTVEDGSVAFAFSWDSMVHCGPDVLEAYTRALARKLMPGARGFIHHSNVGGLRHSVPRESAAVSRHWRDEHMSAQLFREFCERSGLRCLVQELVPCGSDEDADCFSLCVKPEPGRAYGDCAVRQNGTFYASAADRRALTLLYADRSAGAG
jgi:SAM-dependent methyltransferase